MKPIFKIIADAVDITASINQRLISIKTVDEAGMKSDTCTIDIDDRDGLIELPRKGVKLQVWLGYEHTGLTRVGTYIVDEVTLAGFPEAISISAKAADMRSEIKAPKTGFFDNITLGELTNAIAKAHGLIGKAAASMAAVNLGHIDQTQESDMNLLTRLAAQYGGFAKATHDHLIVAKSGESKSVSGEALSDIVINKKQASDYHVSLADRDQYAAVTATYRDKSSSQEIAVSTSADKPVFTLRHTYDDKVQALDAAKAKLTALTQGASTIDVSLAVGNPNLFAESPLSLIGFRSGITGAGWTTTRVEHSLSSAGFSTRVSGEIK